MMSAKQICQLTESKDILNNYSLHPNKEEDILQYDLKLGHIEYDILLV